MLHRILDHGATAIETIRAYTGLLGRHLKPHSEELVWSDEFDYVGLPDPKKWSYQTEANKWTSRPENAELQWYTAERAKNAYVSDGMLRIQVHREEFEGSQYTSARLVTKGKGDFLYGRVEVCAKLPAACRGAWPAIWMLPSENSYGTWPNSGEIDIMENVGFAEGEVRSSIHTERFNHREKSHLVGRVQKKHAHSRFHVYSLEWTPTKISCFVDNHCTLTHSRKPDDAGGHDSATWPFDQKFYLVLNVAVGGNWAGAHGIDNEKLPISLDVAYVRVYQRTDQHSKAAASKGGSGAASGANSPAFPRMPPSRQRSSSNLEESLKMRRVLAGSVASRTSNNIDEMRRLARAAAAGGATRV